MTQTDRPIVAPTIAGPDPNTRAPKFKLPPDSCDCHAHVFGPQSRYAYDPKRRYTPHDASPATYLAMLRKLGVDRGVLVQPSVYMTDNSALIDALEETDFPLRGVAVISGPISDTELQRMHKAGVRGLRLNLRHDNGAKADFAPRLAAQVAPLGWHLQFRINAEDFPSVEKMIEALPVDIVIDHIGALPVEKGLDGVEFRAMLNLVRKGRAWVKLSAPMRMSKGEYPYADVTPFVHRLVAERPDRMVWATDWPHTTITKKMPNDGDLANLLLEWIPDEVTRNRVLVDNPAKLYGF